MFNFISNLFFILIQSVKWFFLVLTISIIKKKKSSIVLYDIFDLVLKKKKNFKAVERRTFRQNEEFKNGDNSSRVIFFGHSLSFYFYSLSCEDEGIGNSTVA